jgi:hypothetical protein
LPKAIDQKVLLQLVAPSLTGELELRNLRKMAVLAVDEGFQTAGKPVNSVVICKAAIKRLR